MESAADLGILAIKALVLDRSKRLCKIICGSIALIPLGPIVVVGTLQFCIRFHTRVLADIKTTIKTIMQGWESMMGD